MSLMAESLDGSTSESLLERTIQVFLSQNLHLFKLGPLELEGMEYPIDGGRIDILASDERTLYVIEVKRGTATREAVGQLQAYVGHMMKAEPTKQVRGILVAADVDSHARAALFAVPFLEFWSFAMSFTLSKADLGRPAPPAPARAATAARLTRFCATCRSERAVRYVLSAAHCATCAIKF